MIRLLEAQPGSLRPRPASAKRAITAGHLDRLVAQALRARLCSLVGADELDTLGQDELDLVVVVLERCIAARGVSPEASAWLRSAAAPDAMPIERRLARTIASSLVSLGIVDASRLTAPDLSSSTVGGVQHAA